MAEGRQHLHRFNLPYSGCHEDELFDPSTGRWRYAFSTIAYDSWLTWRHALPKDCATWSALTKDAALRIKALAERLHMIHIELDDRRSLGESPWRISAWWQPGSPGDSCTFVLDGFPASAVVGAERRIHGRARLDLEPLGPGENPWICARLQGR